MKVDILFIFNFLGGLSCWFFKRRNTVENYYEEVIVNRRAEKNGKKKTLFTFCISFI